MYTKEPQLVTGTEAELTQLCRIQFNDLYDPLDHDEICYDLRDL